MGKGLRLLRSRRAAPILCCILAACQACPGFADCDPVSGSHDFVPVPISLGPYSFTLNAILPRIGKNPECQAPQPFLKEGPIEKACAPRDRITRYYAECVGPELAQAAPSKAALALRRELLKIDFDRELMILNREPSDQAHDADWAAFKAKWEKRAKEDQALLAFDASSEIAAEDRGQLAAQIRSIDGERHRAQARQARVATILGFSRGNPFYTLAAAIATRNIDAEERKELDDLGEASVYLNQAKRDAERDFYYQAYPELILGHERELDTEIRFFMEQSGMSWAKLSRMIHQGEDNAAALKPEAIRERRFRTIATWLNQALASSPRITAEWQRLERGMQRWPRELQGLLDKEITSNQERPGTVGSDIFVTLLAMGSIDPASSPVLAQDLLALQCINSYTQESVDRLSYLNENYFGPALFWGSMALGGFGWTKIIGKTAEAAGRIAASRLGATVPRVAMSGARTMARVGDMGLTAVGTPLLGAIPISVLITIRAARDYQYVRGQFLHNANSPGDNAPTDGNTATKSQIDYASAGLAGEGRMLLLNLAPIPTMLFLRSMTRGLGHL